MTQSRKSGLLPYPQSLAGTLLAAREAVMAPLRVHLRAADVTEQQWRVLRVLGDNGSMDARTIAEQALLYPPSVTRILRELGDRALITRASDPNDARRTVISITAQGRTLVMETAQHTSALLTAYADAFGAQRLDAFRQEAAALAACLDRFQPGD
ncbi:MarR family transcriptional regulator [Sphingobium sp. CAP-1]|uniref:MarR family transcriptional regulator n=1 Tax=Sphingobium sp. CAP-1 TaxID=2676077 RepID=UPI0012BB37C2|nr:MarR family transcriptional regulator [Sphingobium sp. CAP-1]QGP80418.1 MarR family transcriptional regulator [Sphingobium sp. CAP-1]